MSNRFLALALLVAIFAVVAAASVDPDTAAAVEASEVSQSKDGAVGNTDGAGAKDLAPAASEAVEGPVGGPVSAETLSSMSVDGPASAPGPSSAATLKGSSDVINVVAAVVIAAVARGFFL